MDYNICFLGRLFPEINDEKYRKKAKVDMQDAANLLQWNVISGLLDNGCKTISVLSLLPVDSWPKHYSAPFIKRSRETTKSGIDFEIISSCNISAVKQVVNIFDCKHAIKKWAQDKTPKGQKVIIAYTLNIALMAAIDYAKSIDSSIKTVVMIADMPDFLLYPDNLLNFVSSYQKKRFEKSAPAIDGFIVLTKHMRERLPQNSKFLVMEGIAPERKVDTGYTGENKTVLYSGSMNSKYGILTLLEAFHMIQDPEYRLLLCGLGDAECTIREFAEKDKRIKFLGKIKHDEVLKMQCKASVVINPRQGTELFTKYSFPSKNLEYLSSGTPVIGYKLEGIPDEYDDAMCYVSDNSPKALSKKIIEVCSLPEDQRKIIGDKAKKLVSNKCKTKQAVNILNFIDTL